MLKKLSLAVIFFTPLAQIAWSDQNSYAIFGLSHITQNTSTKLTSGNITGLLALNKTFFAIESEANFIIFEDSTVKNSTKIDASNPHFGAFIRTSVPLSNRTETYFRLSHVEVKTKPSLASVQSTRFKTAPAFGISISFSIGGKTSLRFDYTLVDGDGFDTDIFAVGTSFNFLYPRRLTHTNSSQQSRSPHATST